jgi:hypothetical protein
MKLNPTNFKLSQQVWHKRIFDPANAEDLRVYQDFLLNNRWKNGCPFIVEWPFLTVVDLIRHKIVKHHISGLIKQARV